MPSSDPARSTASMCGLTYHAEHVHLLIWPTVEEYDISDTLNSIKQSVAKLGSADSFGPRHQPSEPDGRPWPSGEIHDRFWQPGGGYDRNLTGTGRRWSTR